MYFSKKQAFGIYLLVTILIFSCKKDDCPNLENHEYEIVLEDGIFVEHFDEGVTDENRFNENNEIYKVCNRLKYSFYHEDTLGNKYHFKLNDGGSNLPTQEERDRAWSYVSENETSNNTIKTINQTISSGLDPFLEVLPDYNQTVFDYFYITKKGDNALGETTGLIENEKNVWMHPPRQMMFRILELNPFPYIQKPYEIGNTWEWDYLRPDGKGWSDERWLVWEGNLDMSCDYEMTDFLSVNTPLGEMECYEITAVANNDYGSTKLVAFYNTQYGFVRLNYTNINNTKTTIELIEFN